MFADKSTNAIYLPAVSVTSVGVVTVNCTEMTVMAFHQMCFDNSTDNN